MQQNRLRIVPEKEAKPVTRQQAQHSGQANTSLIIRNVTVDGRRTSVRLEPEMWQSLTEICRRERCSIHNICTMIACVKNGPGSLTAAIRVFIMAYYRDASTEDGHNRMGHGSGSVLQPLFAKLADDDKRAAAEREEAREHAHQRATRAGW